MEARGVRLHYLDFGGTGLPVIFVHDWYEDAHTWTSFAPLFADAYRVLAMTRRGYGKSDDVGWGYDVATQSEDILGFMDALGIERAVLVGRHPTTQDMTWIAEHHPERLAGLVYLYHAIAPSPGEGRMLRDQTFAEMMMRYGGCWMGEEAYHRSAPRLLYRPHYIDDPERRIEVPAISFTHPRDFAAGAGDVEFLDLTLQMATGADPGGGYCDPAAIRTSVDYLTALANDPERLAEVRPLVPTREERRRYAEAFERAFGPGLRIVRLEQPADYRTAPEPYHPHMRTFLGEVARREAARALDPVRGPDVVHVAPPTGEQVADRASILAALEQVEPGGTIQFALGTYLVGESLRIAAPRISLLGHAGGTVLRGCDPDEQEEVERRAVRALVSGDQETYGTMRRRCGLLELTGGNVTVRGLTFEHARTGLVLGCCEGEQVSGDGGYLIEGNAFRKSANGIRASLVSAEPTIIRGNRFVNVFHALSAGVSRVHMLDNDISVPEPERVPGTGHPGFAIGIRPPPPGPADRPAAGPPVCEQNVIAGNRIEGHTDGILLRALEPGTSCRDNTVRDNVIQVRRVPFPVPWLYAGLIPLSNEADTTFVGVPLGLINAAARTGSGDAGSGAVENNRIEGNRVDGAHGVGIQVLTASRNRIVDNTLTGIRRRDPFPGNVTTPGSQEWGEANGSGIWISPGSDGNVVAGNAFEDVAAYEVFLEGDSNRVELQSADHAVRDLGRGNEVMRAGGGDGERSPEEQTRDTVRVATPTGNAQEDRAAILEALEAAGPGGTLRFGPGTYVTGGTRITVTTPGVTLVGDADGTLIRGCDRATLDTLDVATMRQGRCAGLFWLQGGRQAVRSMTLEGVHTALDLGWIAGEVDAPGEDGGYGVEDVTFRRVSKGVNVMGQWAEVATIRDNTFLNVYHAITLQGGASHVLDNDISAPEPGTVFYQGFPGGAISAFAAPECGENVIAGNRIEGHPDGIIVGTLVPGTSCRNNIIRDNVVDVGRVTFGPDAPGRSLINVEHEDDRTVAGVPITILNAEGEEGVPAGAPPEWQGPAFSGNHVIEGNRVLGAPGLGIQIWRSSGNRVANNAIEAVVRREPFPGNHLHLHPGPWEPANGSGIWVSAGSEDNEIIGNTFEDVAGAELFLEGDSNRVTLLSAADSVRDLGSGNRVSGPAGAREPTADPPPSGILEAGRLVFHQLLHPVGEETYSLAREGDAYVLHADFSHNDRGQRTERSVALHLGLDLAPRALQLREIADGDTTETAVEVNGRLATVTDASGSRQVAVPDRFFTTTASAPHAVQALLVRYWLRNGRPASIPVLPRGNAVVRHVGLDTLEVAGETVALDRYHVDGVRWGGQTLWLDGEERLAAAVSFDFNHQAVREGYESALAFFSERARRDVLTRAEAASRRIAPLQTGTFALVGGALIDGTGAPPLADATVVVRDGRITAVGPRASVTIPADAEVVDVTGTTLLPGLWDMHAHLAGITDFGPIYLAAGVTTVRDVGNETDWGLALREAFATGRIAGPRLLLAAEIDGRVPEAVGAIQADTPEEARALVRHFHDLGFEQIKLYSRLRPELVPVIAEEAHRLGMTVTGHVPWGMSTIEALQAGMDQINHLNSVAAIGNMIPATIRESRDVAGALTWLADLDLDLETRSLIDTLVRHGTVVDPTLAKFELYSRSANVPWHEIEPGAARMPPVMANTIERWFPGRPADVAELTNALQRKDVELVGILHRAGVPIVAGTDVVVPGHSLHRELELYVEAGMTPVEAIHAATIVPAQAMGLDHDVGTVEVGKRADLIVVDGDPLRSIREIRNVRAVVANGRIFDTDALWRSVGFETWDQP